MILLAVLAVIGFVMVMVLNLSADATFATQMMVRTRTQDRAYYVGQSAVLAALNLMPDQNGPHTLLDPWAAGTPPLMIDEFVVRVRMVDEERYFNPNQMIGKDQTADPDRTKTFHRLLLLINQDEYFCNALLDWMDSDSLRRTPGGAESTDYPDLPCKNEPLDSIDEIAYIKGATPQMMNGVDNKVQKIPGLRELLTVHSNGTLNINTAPAFVLQAAAQTMDDNVIASVIAQRAKQPFKRMEDILNVPGVTQEHLYFLRKFGDIKSTTWRIEAFVVSQDTENPVQLRVAGIIRGNAKQYKVLSWEVNEVSDVSSFFSKNDAHPYDVNNSASPSPAPSGSGSPGPTESPSRGDSSGAPSPQGSPSSFMSTPSSNSGGPGGMSTSGGGGMPASTPTSSY